MTGIPPQFAEGLHFFGNVYSNNAQRVMLLLAEKGIAVQMHEVNLLKSEQLTADYLLLNPKGEVPALVHHGHAMHESCDIMRYLESESPEPSFSPEGERERQRMNVWLSAAAESHTAVVKYVYSHGLGRLPTPRDWEFYRRHIPHRAKFHEARRKGLVAGDRAAAVAALNGMFAELESTLTDCQWLVGGRYSLADMAWFGNANALTVLGYSLDKFPNVRSWVKRIQARPAYRTGVARHRKKLPDWLLRLTVRVINRTGDRH